MNPIDWFDSPFGADAEHKKNGETKSLNEDVKGEVARRFYANERLTRLPDACSYPQKRPV